jgi:transcription antitermination factor NusG
LPDPNWFVLLVEPQSENRVAARAAVLGLDAFYPISRRLVRGCGRRCRHAVLRNGPAMPGYVFVRIGAAGFGRFRRDCNATDAVPHCVRFLGDERGPTAIGAEAITDLRTRQAAGEFDLHARQGRHWAPRWLRPGASVKVVDGPLKGCCGEITRLVRHNIVAVLLLMLGVPRLVELPLDWVARLK